MHGLCRRLGSREVGNQFDNVRMCFSAVGRLAYLMGGARAATHVGEGSARKCADRVALGVRGVMLCLLCFALRAWAACLFVIWIRWAAWFVSSLFTFFGEGSYELISVFSLVVDLVLFGGDLKGSDGDMSYFSSERTVFIVVWYAIVFS